MQSLERPGEIRERPRVSRSAQPGLRQLVPPTPFGYGANMTFSRTQSNYPYLEAEDIDEALRYAPLLDS